MVRKERRNIMKTITARFSQDQYDFLGNIVRLELENELGYQSEQGEADTTRCEQLLAVYGELLNDIRQQTKNDILKRYREQIDKLNKGENK